MTSFVSHIAELTNVSAESIDDSTEFRKIPGWDSLAMLSLIVMFDDEYGVSVTNDTLQRATTIGDLRSLAGTT